MNFYEIKITSESDDYVRLYIKSEKLTYRCLVSLLRFHIENELFASSWQDYGSLLCRAVEQSYNLDESIDGFLRVMKISAGEPYTIRVKKIVWFDPNGNLQTTK